MFSRRYKVRCSALASGVRWAEGWDGQSALEEKAGNKIITIIVTVIIFLVIKITRKANEVYVLPIHYLYKCNDGKTWQSWWTHDSIILMGMSPMLEAAFDMKYNDEDPRWAWGHDSRQPPPHSAINLSHTSLQYANVPLQYIINQNTVINQCKTCH